MSTDPSRCAINGPTMGTRWSALFYEKAPFDQEPVRVALQAAVDEVDNQMSTWNPHSALMQLNAAPVEVWLDVPAALFEVLALGLRIGHASEGAFDIAMGDAVTAWGFGPEVADPARIRAAISASPNPVAKALELDTEARRVRKTAPLVLDLNGIAKGYGVDRLAETLRSFGIEAGLVGIDGEMRAHGLRPDGSPWTIAVEAPDPDRRTPQSVLSLEDAAVATSGDYRHWVDVQGHRLSHTMDPTRRAPLRTSPASVTVVARTCAEADAWATALMVVGVDAGVALARDHGLNALFLLRDDALGIRGVPVGPVFGGEASAALGGATQRAV